VETYKGDELDPTETVPEEIPVVSVV